MLVRIFHSLFFVLHSAREVLLVVCVFVHYNNFLIASLVTHDISAENLSANIISGETTTCSCGFVVLAVLCGV